VHLYRRASERASERWSTETASARARLSLSLSRKCRARSLAVPSRRSGMSVPLSLADSRDAPARRSRYDNARGFPRRSSRGRLRLSRAARRRSAVSTSKIEEAGCAGVDAACAGIREGIVNPNRYVRGVRARADTSPRYPFPRRRVALAGHSP